MSKSLYLLRCLAAQFAVDRYRCPNCGDTADRIVDRKFIITQLRRCGTCKLLFRTPTDRPESNQANYEYEYLQGFTTSLPSDAALAEMKRSNFANTDKSYSYYISVLSQLGLKPGTDSSIMGVRGGTAAISLLKPASTSPHSRLPPPVGALRTRNWACGLLMIWNAPWPTLPVRSTASFRLTC
jgi:hypothetical protein